VGIDSLLFPTDERKGYIQEAGGALQEVSERDPSSRVEYASHRAQVLARKAVDRSSFGTTPTEVA
jgi:hypothetical protein